MESSKAQKLSNGRLLSKAPLYLKISPNSPEEAPSAQLKISLYLPKPENSSVTETLPLKPSRSPLIPLFFLSSFLLFSPLASSTLSFFFTLGSSFCQKNSSQKYHCPVPWHTANPQISPRSTSKKPAPKKPSLQLPKTLLHNGFQIPMQRVKLSLAPQFHYLIL